MKKYINETYDSYKFIILVIILILSLCALFYYKTLSDKKSNDLILGTDLFGNYSEYSKKYILEDCQNGWGKEYKLKYPNDKRTLEEICMNNAYLSNPKLLCGICGDTDNNPLFTVSSPSDPNKKYFGCARNSDNSISINWGDQGTPINKLLSDRLTCDVFNVNAKSGMYIYIATDDTCSILLNDKVVANHNGINIGEYFIDNVNVGDTLSIKCKSAEGTCGLCFCYIWNKQIYILENNGYQNCANTIYYTTEGLLKWDNIWKDTSVGLLPWMKNWMRSNDGSNSTLNVTTYVGSNKESAYMNNDCVIIGSITFRRDQDHSLISQTLLQNSIFLLSSMGINSGNKTLLFDTNYKKNIDNRYFEYRVENVNDGDNFVLAGLYKDENKNISTLNYSLCYIWCGRIFVLPRGDNFDNITGKITLKDIYSNTDTTYSLVNKEADDQNILYFQKKLLNPTKTDILPAYIFSVNNSSITDENKSSAKGILAQLKITK